MAREFRLPDLGEGIAEGQIIRVLCAEGDAIAEDQAIFEVETDKAAVEIPSPYEGKATKIHVKEGQTVAVGEVLVTIEESNGQTAAGAAVSTEKRPTAKEQAAKDAKKKSSPPVSNAPANAPVASVATSAPKTPSAPVASPQSVPVVASAPRGTRAVAAPAVRKYARERGVDIDTLRGSGPAGRVLRSDVDQAGQGGTLTSVASAPRSPVVAPMPRVAPVIEGTPDTDKWGSLKRQKLSQVRKTIAKQMVKSVSTIPHVTQTDEADVTMLDQMRRDLRGPDGTGQRVTMMAFILQALAKCLRLHPVFNASFDAENEEIVYKEYINIGIAVDSPRGLIVPVMRDVDRLSVLGIGQELTRIGQQVHAVNFTVDELRGGSFTVTNYGAIGGIWGTPVINHPEVAILGVGRTQNVLRLAEGDRVETRRILPLSLSFDHRAADGAQAARFLNDVVAHLSQPGLLLIG